MQTGPKIFLVDKDLFSLSVFRTELADLGYGDVSLFLNSTICFNNLYQQPHIIFLVYNSTDPLDFETFKKIKLYDSGIYVVIICDEGNRAFAENAMQHGVFDCIIKGENNMLKIKNVITRIESIIAN